MPYFVIVTYFRWSIILLSHDSQRTHPRAIIIEIDIAASVFAMTALTPIALISDENHDTPFERSTAHFRLRCGRRPLDRARTCYLTRIGQIASGITGRCVAATHNSH
ncbi:hypothetical protein EVAR_76913_1 [Eumeta japonica]|uniref:Uncharacterized protein n=1 Tax=Eumeta variegata TaxID=151549 RepID=A0A4C1SEV8_EUMVA|nr:hypothetical protein EVAR_76913_1 [Eumeta japonica]